MNRTQAEQLLKTAQADPTAQFRSGQWESIDALINQRQKMLVVQRTGWGKSSVYFISAKAFRDRGLGPTIIVSPLLALMRNQIASAARLVLRPHNKLGFSGFGSCCNKASLRRRAGALRAKIT